VRPPFLVRKIPMMQEATVAQAICAVYTFEFATRQFEPAIIRKTLRFEITHYVELARIRSPVRR
jgi:hypothetical protein